MKLAIGLLLTILVLIFFINKVDRDNEYIRTASQRYRSVTPPPTPTPTPIQALDAKKLFTLVNDYRESQGLNRLASSSAICKLSDARLPEIRTDWSHNGFWPHKYEFFSYVYAGENLGRGYFDEKEQVDGWIKSPSHRENLKNPHYTHSCISTDVYLEQSYAVQEFASF